MYILSVLVFYSELLQQNASYFGTYFYFAVLQKRLFNAQSECEKLHALDTLPAPLRTRCMWSLLRCTGVYYWRYERKVLETLCVGERLQAKPSPAT